MSHTPNGTSVRRPRSNPATIPTVIAPEGIRGARRKPAAYAQTPDKHA
ncbi:MAG TPA: hypothetical protein VFJ87_12905 [Rhodanobacteraceae bacterium]|nr:hypothetical protein [Rhodanobacteraceae bacterium]